MNSSSGAAIDPELAELLNSGMNLSGVMSLNRNMNKLTQKVVHNEWLPEKRARYNSKRRDLDREMIFTHWNGALPSEATENKVNLSDVPPKIQKKYKRAVAVHADSWRMKDTESVQLFEETKRTGVHTNMRHAAKKMASDSVELLGVISKVLPTYNSKSIVDIPVNFRAKDGGWDSAGDRGVTILRFWNLCRNTNFFVVEGEQYELALRYIDDALTLIPPLRKGEIPHNQNLQRACALGELGDSDSALLEFRLCLAAIRLLDYNGKVDMTDQTDILIKKTNGLSQKIIRHLVKIKVRDCTSRPYFTADARLDLMKELGIGMYSPDSLKCSCCLKTDIEAKLSLCSRCNNVWYCRKECAKKAWVNGHKTECSQGSRLQLHPSVIKKILQETAEPGGVSMVESFLEGNLLIICKDFTTGKIFEVLFDQDLDMEEKNF